MVALITSLKEFGCQFPYFYLHFKHFFNVQAEVGDFFFSNAVFPRSRVNLDHQLLSQHEREILKAEGPCGEIEIALCKARDEFEPQE